ncbi:MAG: hypothetical protein C0609_00605 [Deltaproteobacteria bacterium]|nr:MAG: hypothetical protein C0609_00605 [Deltaproteobacteria bacterium]
MKKLLPSLLVAFVALAVASGALARTKLTALPEREVVTIRLDNPDATLIEEERVLALQAGENQVDFSWRGVGVNPDSIRLKALSHPESVTLLSVSYPPGEAALVWRINASEPLEERVRISYLLRDIDRLVAYRAVADKAETTLDITGLRVLRNFSGEDFDEAIIAMEGGSLLTTPSKNGETRRAVLFRANDVPMTKTLVWDSGKLPWEPAREEQDVSIPVFYEFINTADAGLGQGSLWEGKMRVFQDDGHEATIFLGEDNVEFTPPGAKMRVNIGFSRDVRVTKKRLEVEELNHRPSRKDPVLRDRVERFAFTVENFKDTPVALEIVEHPGGDWEVGEANMEWERKSSRELLLHVPLGPGEKRELAYSTLTRDIWNR